MPRLLECRRRRIGCLRILAVLQKKLRNAPGGAQAYASSNRAIQVLPLRPAVQNVNFSLEPGQILGYLGQYGSGKSTTVKTLTDLLQPTHGRVTYDGEDVHKNLVSYRKHLSYVPEEANLYPFLSGQEYLEMVGTLRAMPEARSARRIRALLDLLSLGSHRHPSLGSYSKGMRQRILLITALMDNADVLILDEPLSGLDVTSALVFKNLVQGLSARGKAIFYCSHVLEVVEKVCTDSCPSPKFCNGLNVLHVT